MADKIKKKSKIASTIAALGGLGIIPKQQELAPPPTEQPAEVLKIREPQKEAPRAQPTTPEVFKDNKTGEQSGITTIGGQTFLGLNAEDIARIAGDERAKSTLPAGTQPVGTAQKQVDQAVQGQQLQGQVGQFEQQPISPTGLDFGEATRQGIVGAIPRALSLAAAGAAVGATGGTAVLPGIGTAAGAGLGAVTGFVSGIASSMISNLKTQRVDTKTAQKRVLTEASQSMKDWATLAQADPANKAYYLGQYNLAASQIDKAYRQMKLDTSRDLAAFESSIPELAQFEAFYAAGGEKDILDLDMKNSLLMPTSPEYRMLELAERRKDGT